MPVSMEWLQAKYAPCKCGMLSQVLWYPNTSCADVTKTHFRDKECIPHTAPIVPEPHAPGTKLDGGKARLDLLPFKGLEQVAAIMAFGAKKYSEGGWRDVPNAKARYTAAALRHLFAYARGEKTDPESGLHHLAHCCACLLFILDKFDP